MNDALPQGRFEWNAERIARVKAIAVGGGTAREAAIAIELPPEQDYLLYALAKREGFRFGNAGRKRNEANLLIQLPNPETSRLLADSAKKHGHERRDHAAKLLALVLLQGPTFIDNLLDEV